MSSQEKKFHDAEMATQLSISTAEMDKSGDAATDSKKNRVSVKEKATTCGLAGVAKLVKLLPATTVLIFYTLSPLFTNAGHGCHKVNKILTGSLLGICALSCYFASFTDSFRDEHGKIYYGIATKTGLWIFNRDSDKIDDVDLSVYRLRFRDFVHAVLSVVVFGTIAVVNNNVVKCFYPDMTKHEKGLFMVLPGVVGVLASMVFIIFPSKRHGIGYPHPK